MVRRHQPRFTVKKHLTGRCCSAAMACGEEKPSNENSKGLKPETIRWWDDRVEQLIAEQRGSDALALADEFIIPRNRRKPGG